MSLPINSERLLIREWIVKDAGQFLEVGKKISWSQAKNDTLDDAERKIIEWALMFGQTKMGILPVFLKHAEVQIGVCGIKPMLLDQSRLHFEVICHVSENYSNQGYETEIILEMQAYGFKVLGLQELVAVGSSEILEKAGMSFLKSVDWQNRKLDLYSVSAQ